MFLIRNRSVDKFFRVWMKNFNNTRKIKNSSRTFEKKNLNKYPGHAGPAFFESKFKMPKKENNIRTDKSALFKMFSEHVSVRSWITSCFLQLCFC